jgi:hypothetical protein
MNTARIRKVIAGAAITGALGFASVGLGAGQASADDDWWWEPPSPGHFVPSPGHIAQLPFVPPPGHWDKHWKWWK